MVEGPKLTLGRKTAVSVTAQPQAVGEPDLVQCFGSQLGAQG